MDNHSLNCLRRKACYEKLEEINKQILKKKSTIEKFKVDLIAPAKSPRKRRPSFI